MKTKKNKKLFQSQIDRLGFWIFIVQRSQGSVLVRTYAYFILVNEKSYHRDIIYIRTYRTGRYSQNKGGKNAKDVTTHRDIGFSFFALYGNGTLHAQRFNSRLLG